MHLSKNKTMATAVSLFLIFAMAISLIALPAANAQAWAPIMNPATNLVLLHQSMDIDLNGPNFYIETVILAVMYPGRTYWTWVGNYSTESGGDLDVYDFDFNETGNFRLKWIIPPQDSIAPNPDDPDGLWHSNVEIVTAITEDMLVPRSSYAYIGAVPNPVGVGQEVLLHVGITMNLMLYWMGWEGLSITITKPDGTTETISGIRTDSTGGTGVVYVPTMVGNYTLQSHFPEQKTTENNQGAGIPAGTKVLASDSRKLTLVVQSDPIPYYPGHPLPTEYWTRPIDAQLHEWSPIAGNWVDEPPNALARYNDDAPETAHILWVKELLRGGLGGGEFGPHSFECGDAYEGKFSASAILAGVLYYNRYESRMPTQEVVAVDLHTGEELWCRPLVNPDGDVQRLSFGQMFYWDAWNYHAIFGYLWGTTGSTWNAYNPLTGDWIYTYENMPGGSTVIGPKGEIYRIDVNEGRGWMRQWNSSRAVQPQLTGSSGDGSWRPHGNTYDATETGFDFDVTIPRLPGSAYLYELGDKVVGSHLTATGSYRSDLIGVKEIIHWALSLKPGQEGQLLYNKTWKAPADWVANNVSLVRAFGSIEDGVIGYWSKDLQQYWGFSTETGEYLWGPTEPQNYLDHYGLRDYVAYGKLFSQGMSGILHCYNAKTGELLWTYAADDPYNQVLWANDWSIRPVFFADGKIYMGNSEHSPVDPKPRGGPFVCVDVETGEEVWRADGLFRQTDWGGRAIIGDSIIATMDTYDQRVYAIGKGPSATTVTAAPEVSVHGSSVLVKGMVTDISPGTEEYALTARFPHGVPAVADENMSDWMLYVYKQFPRPTDATGVEVVIEVLDPNNNYYEVGRTTSDANGMFKLAFTPEVPGEYTIIATFAGSEAYYGSFAQTAINVEEAPAATPAPTPTPAPMTDTYVLGTGIAILIAIVVGFALLLLRKR